MLDSLSANCLASRKNSATTQERIPLLRSQQKSTVPLWDSSEKPVYSDTRIAVFKRSGAARRQAFTPEFQFSNRTAPHKQSEEVLRTKSHGTLRRNLAQRHAT